MKSLKMVRTGEVQKTGSVRKQSGLKAMDESSQKAPSSIKTLASMVASLLACHGTSVVAGQLPVPAAALTSLGRADLAVNGSDMVINQKTEQAILNWQSFNIGSDSSVRFNQPDSSAIALNNIFQGDPSQIMGKLSSNGQVYLINQNGFVFGQNSQVDVNTLLVSTLAISDDTLQRGITKVLGQDGSAALVGKGEVYRKDAQGNFILDANGNKEKVSIQFLQGSQVTTGQNGRLIAAAPEVTNAGTLTSPDGQILLVAASDKVYLQEASGDPNLRGLLVEVKTGGEVTNTGQITTLHGNTTMMGFAVNQAGRISANTSVSQNGSIRLLAREGASVQSTVDGYVLKPGTTTRSSDQGDGLGLNSKVTFKSGSETTASPDLTDKTTAVDAQPQVASKIDVMGESIEVQDKAVVRSNSGSISMIATENPLQPLAAGAKNNSNLKVDSGAVLDVSGIKNVKIPLTRNVVTVELRSNELRDSPLQRKGILYGQKVQVDIRKGTPIADISGAVARIARTVAERSTTGGTINLSSEGSVALQKSSALDFSGGSINWLSGFIKTTQLVRADGRTFDISKADPNAKYIAFGGNVVEKFPDWNLTKVTPIAGPTNQGRYEQGYTEGKSAGALNIQAAVADLQGDMQAIAVNGPHQRTPDLQALGGSLSIDLTRTVDNNQSVIIQKDPATGEATGTSSPLEIQAGAIRASGIQSLSINTNGKIEIAQDANLDLLSGSKLTLTGGEISDAGTITSHGGTVAFNSVYNPSGQTSGLVTLADGSRIDLTGIWNNDKPATPGNKATLDNSQVWKDGGSFSVKAKGDVNVAAGSLIDVSGGAQRTQDGVIHPGNAGSIVLSAQGINGSDLNFSGSLSGYAVSGGKGGTLTLASNLVQIGSDASGASPADGAIKPLVIDPSLTTRGGFETYNFVSNKSGLTVVSGTDLSLKVENRILDLSAASKVTGSDLNNFSTIGLQSDLVRPAGALNLGLALNAQLPAQNALLTVEEGARISTDAGGKIGLSSDTSILVKGELSAPAGKIALHVTPPTEQGELGFLPTQGIWLSDTANLNAKGAALTYTDGYGRILGNILDGGSINLTADRGFIEIGSLAQLDASGISRLMDNPVPGPSGSIAYQRTDVASAGGSIALTAAEGMQILGNLTAQAGNSSGKVAGGTLSLELNTLNRRPPGVPGSGQLPFPSVPSVIEVSQAFGTDATANDPQVGVAKSDYGIVKFSADQLAAGGFSNLKLTTQDEIHFVGNVDLSTNRSINLDAPVLMAAMDPATYKTGDVSLTSAYVSLGSSVVRPGYANASGGTSTLNVQADQIDLKGEGVLKGFNAANLTSQGDIRMSGIRILESDRDFLGEFSLAGDLKLSASQIYPTTLSDFTVSVTGKSDGVIEIEGNGNKQNPVLSAAGNLTLSAPTINQGGTIRAPLGTISLNATQALDLKPGSLTSNSADGSTIPFGRLQAGLTWIYPLGSQNLVFNSPPEKAINLSGNAINFESGATIDSKGGGDLQAFEFLPGPGGSYDRLDASSPGYIPSFAVLPAFTHGSAPIDPLETGSNLKVGDTVYLSGGAAGLKAGDYVLLPAHYALLPGAYLITPQALKTNIVPGESIRSGDGARVVAGYYEVSGTQLKSPVWSGFAVEKGTKALTRSEFTLDTANHFFGKGAGYDATQPAWLPQDGGKIQIAAQSALNLDGTLIASGVGSGRGGQLDIAGDELSVLAPADAGQSAGGSIVISSDFLNQADVSSISLGGLRKSQSGTTVLDVKSTDVSIGKGVELSGQEIILSAKGQVHVDGGASISATAANGSKTRGKLNVAGDAAVVRVSSDAQDELFRTGATGSSGSILIDSGAKLSATGSMMLDATGTNTLNGSLDVTNASLALGANRISVGDSDPRAGGLVLGSSLLSGVKPSELILSSGSDISFFGTPTLNATSLALHAGALLGFSGQGSATTISSDTVVIDNRNQATTLLSGDGQGSFAVNSKNLTLGEGQYAVSGFSGVNLSASNGILTQGNGQLKATENLVLNAPFLVAGASANTVIDASGHSIQMTGTGSATPKLEALGSRLSVTADSIQSSMLIDLPSGSVSLDAKNGDLMLGAGSVIDASGRKVQIGGSTVATDGGVIHLSAENGNVVLSQNSTLNLSGQNAGLLSVNVPKGAFNWQGTVLAKGVSKGGLFDLTVGSSDSLGSLGGLGTQLASAGFTDGIQLDAKGGDLNLGASDTLSARLISLAAEAGSIQIDGKLQSQGMNAAVDLVAANKIGLGANSSIQASGTSAGGGTLVLDTVTLNPQNKDGIVVDAGARIDVSSAEGLSNGSTLFRVTRSDGAVAIQGPLGSAIKGSSNTIVEADKVFMVDSPVGSASGDAFKTDALGFMATAAGIESQLGLVGEVKAGIILDALGDLTIDTTGLDLAAWHQDGRSGVLTLMSAGSIHLNGSLSDGFVDNPEGIKLADGKTTGIKDQLQTENSWSYRMLAGKDIVIGADQFVRTGTGNIDLNAGNDVVLSNAGSAIYTMGKATSNQRYGSLSDQVALQNNLSEYPIDGGSIRVTASHDVVGAVTGQFFDGWLQRAGNWSNVPDHSGQTPTSWGVHVGGVDGGAQVAFQQNIGALGGGNVSVNAGHDVKDLSVIIATTGKPVGALANPGDPSSQDFLTNQVQVGGGGNLQIQAADNIYGGTYYTGRGTAEIKAQGSILASEKTGMGAVLALGDSQFKLSAGDQMVVGAALNPTVISNNTSSNYFFTYSPSSALTLSALSGTIELQNDTTRLISELNKIRPYNDRILFPGLAADALTVYPASLEVTAVQGNVKIDNSLVMFPSATGVFRFNAGSDITTADLQNFVYVTMSDADPSLLPSVTAPVSSWNDASRRLQPFGLANYIHAQTPIHADDKNFAQINAGGSILGIDPILFTLPTGANIQAGLDIRDASFSLQHNRYELSTITAGRDFKFTTPRNRLGNLINSSGEVALSGPGDLVISAGRNIDLGASIGVFSTGKTVNSALPAGDGNITVLAGMGPKGPQYDAFAAKYDPLSSTYADLLTAFMAKVTGNASIDKAAAATQYQALSQGERDLFLFDILFNELRQSATNAAKSGKSADYAQGYTAIDTMFPGAGTEQSSYAGDLSLFFSKISTVSGGDVNLLAPGGSINAGLASAFTGAKQSSDLGVVVQGSGSINSLVNNNFMVNQSRVFALGGGDITIWSSNGNIDAGRGAKAALTIPPPQVTFDASGNLKIVYPPAVSGSGIRTASSAQSKPGDVYLAAPRGVVDAGEAGIGGSNITIAATAVLGASNIQVSGSATGVPSSAAVPIAPAGAAAAATAAANTAESAVNNDTNQAKERNAMADNAMNPLSVDILGFGECGVADVREGKPGCV